MTQRNIHGDWTMSFEKRVVLAKTIGSINAEACVAWLDEMKDKIQSSPEGYTTPWVLLTDSRDWEGGSPESWANIDDILSWMFSHNCIFNAVVVNKKLQIWAGETNLNNQYYKVFYDYDEAYQTCLDKLAEAQQDK
ncbi:hypothetical protein L4C34_10330 [Vibrio profundum]|uniref:hypothetical protein n=1 Tax=Vibrio profundum TaxID=2910247 RepID=UPI003D13062B